MGGEEGRRKGGGGWGEGEKGGGVGGGGGVDRAECDKDQMFFAKPFTPRSPDP